MKTITPTCCDQCCITYDPSLDWYGWEKDYYEWNREQHYTETKWHCEECKLEADYEYN